MDVIEYLNGKTGASEAAEIRTYSVWIDNAEVRVEVMDHGPLAGSQRYAALAYSPDIPESQRQMNTRGLSLGNPDSDLKGALGEVHWNVFRQDS
jgi:hypothetical protein